MREPTYKKLTADEFDRFGKRILYLESELFPPEEQWDSAKDFKDIFTREGAVRFVAEEGNRLVGFGMGVPAKDVRDVYVEDDGSPSDKFNLISDDHFHIWTVEVDKQDQGNNVALNLAHKLVDHAKEQGYKGVSGYLRRERYPTKNLKGHLEGILGRLYGEEIHLEKAVPVMNYADTGKTYILCTMKF